MRSERSPVPTWLRRLRGALGVALARARCRRGGARSTFIALALFLCCDFSSCWLTTRPVGRWVMRTALSVVLTDWPPGPLDAEHVDAQILVVDLDVDLLGLGQHGDGRGRGVDAALRLGRRHALDAVHARFELRAARTRRWPGDRGDDFLVAAGRGFARREHRNFPAHGARRSAGTCGRDRRRRAPPRRRRCRRGSRGSRSSRRRRPWAEAAP